MNKKILLTITVALIISCSGAVIAQQRSKMTAIDSSEAVQKFRDICVAHYLDRKALFAKLESMPGTWTLYQKRRPSDISGGLYLESSRGEVGYVSLPNQRPSNNDPACHFTFIPKKQATHQSLVTSVSRDLGLMGGKNTTSKNSEQVRWDYQNINGTLARIFVSSGVNANGRVVSRLSISRHRMPHPTPLGQTI